ncbi:MAG: PorP/SprF family type IX secretion system membrane protein [Bacteroidota bacterium]
MKKSLLIVILIITTGFGLQAQQMPMYGQYLFNSTVINPAQAGTLSHNQAGILGRYQWVGIDGAPTAHTAFANLILPYDLGVAAGIFQDQVGPLREISFQADISYKAQISRDWFLAAGLRTMTSSMALDMSMMEEVNNDPLFNSDLSTGFRINMGMGLLLFSENHFIGIAMPRAVNVMKRESHTPTNHLFFYGGSTFGITREITIAPAFLFKNVALAPAQLDISIIGCYDNLVDFGPVIRTNMAKDVVDAIGFTAGLNISENWYFGYMYEYPANRIRTSTVQTHEISLRYQWESSQSTNRRSPSIFLYNRRRR